MNVTNPLASVTAINNGEIYKTVLTSGDRVFFADEPKEFGGAEAGPAPAEYLCMALASCKAITLRMYVERKGWKLSEIKINVSFVKGDQLPSRVNSFFCAVHVEGEVNDEQKKRLLEIARACPVERLIAKPAEVVTVME